jgi:hypothetical protein
VSTANEVEIKVAERTSELRRSERELRDVIDTIPAMVWSTLPDGTNTYDFTVPTIHLRVLFVFLVLEHQRRKVLHFGVTEHPRAEWAAQQVVEAFTERDAKPYLIRERDCYLWQRVPAPHSIVGDQRDHHCTTESLAERIRRTTDWLHSA